MTALVTSWSSPPIIVPRRGMLVSKAAAKAFVSETNCSLVTNLFKDSRRLQARRLGSKAPFCEVYVSIILYYSHMARLICCNYGCSHIKSYKVLVIMWYARAVPKILR